MSLKWFLYDLFSSLDRGFLLESKSREQMVHYFNTIIEQFRDTEVESSSKEECKSVIKAAIEFHSNAKLENENICRFGKFHDILYVAAKLCHQWDLHDTEVVRDLLQSIYACERTFEKFFECSIFGTKVTQLISGRRSDYLTDAENLDASMYFLKHAADSRLRVPYGDRECNFVDVPMHSYEKLSPLKAAVKAEKWDVAIVFIKHGAITHLSYPSDHRDAYSLLRLFVQKLERYDRFAYYKAPLNYCFKLFVRTIASLSEVWTREGEADEEEARSWPEVLTWLQEIGFEDVTNEPRSLKHLARCSARLHLAEHHRLPAHHQQLVIPKVVESYLNLEND